MKQCNRRRRRLQCPRGAPAASASTTLAALHRADDVAAKAALYCPVAFVDAAEMRLPNSEGHAAMQTRSRAPYPLAQLPYKPMPPTRCRVAKTAVHTPHSWSIIRTRRPAYPIPSIPPFFPRWARTAYRRPPYYASACAGRFSYWSYSLARCERSRTTAAATLFYCLARMSLCQRPRMHC